MPYVASDVGSGLRDIALYYRRDGGAWTLYDGAIQSAPTLFDPRTTGRDGYYELYTRATDRAGNVEDAPAVADFATTVIIHDLPVVYVDAATTGAQTGANWVNAFPAISPALEVADSFDIPSVWVAEGTYRESLSLVSEVAVLGSFAGSETDLSQRDFLSGLSIVDAPSTVTVVADNVDTATLDGFVVLGGADMAVYLRRVGGDVEVVNCSIAASGGHGVHCDSANPVIENCRIGGNLGSGVRCDAASPHIVNCLIAANREGGVACVGELRGIIPFMWFVGSLATVDFCTIAGNSGHALYFDYDSDATIRNSIIEGSSGFGVFEERDRSFWGSTPEGSDPFVVNCLFHDNGRGDYYDENATTYSGADAINVNVTEASDNLSGDPVFINRATGDYRLGYRSAAIDTASSLNAPATDIDGAPRPVDIAGYGPDDGSAQFDIGAMERQDVPDPSAAAVLDHLLGATPLPAGDLVKADANADGRVDIADVILLNE